MERFRLVFSGSGGQGVITASIILAEAAVLYENMNAVQSQVYGPAARGGAARSDVLISERAIDFPKVTHPNVLVALTQAAYNAYTPIIRPGSLLITDTRFVKIQSKVDARQRELPLYDTVMEKIGNPIVFNICVLGALVALTEIVKPQSVMRVLSERVPAGSLEMNQKALELGLDLGRNAGSLKKE